LNIVAVFVAKKRHRWRR